MMRGLTRIIYFATESFVVEHSDCDHNRDYARLLNAAGDYENDENQQNQANATARTVTPVAAVSPGWDGAEQGKYQQYNKNSSKHDYDSL
jgi:hypothetical protein